MVAHYVFLVIRNHIWETTKEILARLARTATVKSEREIMSDFSDSNEIAARMQSATGTLHKLAPNVGAARQCREYDSDRRKRLLAKYVAPLLKTGESATAAEHLARSNVSYGEELEKLAEQYASAEKIIAQNQAELCSFEAARSLLSFSRETLRNIPE